jgi:tetratricopeptide (TPR) repeat protein
LDLARSAVDLIADFPFTGGGLAAFAGLFSQYIRITPFFLFAYSHNFYLDVTLEQGVVGGLVSLWIFLGSGWLLARQVFAGHKDSKTAWLTSAALASWLVICLHGLVDDALYGMNGTPLLFFLPGIAVALSQANPPAVLDHGKTKARAIEHLWLAAAVLSILVLLVAILRWSTQARAYWYANLGAVRMARSELEDWPTNQWNENPDISSFAPAIGYFSRALERDPENRISHHRLGLIAMQARDYGTAQSHLEAAHAQKPGHRGIRKALGYCYVWNGQLDRAADLLKEIPEAEYELGVYVWWWGQQGRKDLANQAEAMQDYLRTHKS